MRIEGDSAKLALMGMAKGMGNKTQPKKTSLECPVCQCNLYYPEKVVHLDPPRKRVICKACGYKDFHYIKEE